SGRVRGAALAFAVALAVATPFLWWNATHAWATFAFAFAYRHEESHGFSLVRLGAWLALVALVYSPGLALVGARLVARPANALLAWTSLPLIALVAALALVERVEVYWILGPAVSLAVAAAVRGVRLAPSAFRRWSTIALAPAAALLALVAVLGIAPLQLYGALHRATGLALKNDGAFDAYSYAAVAQDASRLARERGAVVMTDGYGFSSIIAFDAGAPPVVVGYDWQGRQSRAWFPDDRDPAAGLFVDKEPLRTRPDIAAHLARACARVEDGGTHAYAIGALPARDYYFTWCLGMKPQGLAILRWERERA
ncbi:MAG: hypothetical protein ACREQ5_32515, partial [Candidatus Dormibacteria bacterium]